jgi:hypothetical protein
MKYMQFCRIAVIIIGIAASSLVYATGHDTVSHPAPVASGTETDRAELAKQSQNPVASLISVPIETNSNFGVGDADNYQQVMNIKPVIPGDFSENWNLISRAIIPVIMQDNLTSTGTGLLTDESQSGLADVTYQGFFTKKKSGKWIWGIGPQLTVPIGDDAFTSDKWSAGPSLVVLTMPGKWVVGSLVSQAWDFAGKGSAEDVSALTWQYFVNYNLSGGWYLTSAPVMTANWKAERSSDKWTIPVGGGGGRVFAIGEQHVKISGQLFGYVTTPDAVDTDWTAQLSFTFLFPTSK